MDPLKDKEQINATIQRSIAHLERPETTHDERYNLLGYLMLSAYEKGREDVHSGQSNDILGLTFTEPTW
jgi:hypothetical protein